MSDVKINRKLLNDVLALPDEVIWSWTTSHAIAVGQQILGGPLGERLEKVAEQERAKEADPAPSDLSIRNAKIRAYDLEYCDQTMPVKTRAETIERDLRRANKKSAPTEIRMLAAWQILQLRRGKPLKARQIFDIIKPF